MNEDAVVLEWTFSPKDYFEEEKLIERDDYKMRIMDGVVEARVDPKAYDREHKKRDILHKSLEDMFVGAQVLTHRPFELSKSNMYRLHSDGRKDVTIFPDPMTVKCSMGSVDFVLKDSNGNVVSDSQRERIEKKNAFAELAEKYSSDVVAAALLKSYRSSVNDPPNELVHLYEIRDALSDCFGGEKHAREMLALTKGDWSILGKLANDEPLKQGRHRGKSAGELRDASEPELEEGRRIARIFVESYLNYLESKHQGKHS